MAQNSKHNFTNYQTGLSKSEAKKRFEKYGPNVLKSDRKIPLLIKFLLQFDDILIYILLISGIVSLLLKEITDSLIIFFVVLMNGIIGFIQEEKATKSLEALKKMSSPNAVVRRDGETITINASEVVIGDIIILQEGQAVPADAKIIKSYSLLCDESALTGESHPVLKDETKISKESTPLAEKLDCVFMSTLVLAGNAEAIVEHTAMDTEIGKIANLLDKNQKSETNLQKKLASLGKILGIVTIFICAFLFILAVLQKRNVVEMFITSISLAVAAIPEGLPAVVTIVLAIGVQRLIKVNMIVRKLHSVETLGAVSKILTDKTGTLTENQLTIKSLSYNSKIYKLQDVDVTTKEPTFNTLLSVMNFCNNAKIKNDRIGDPAEIAMLEFVNAFNFTYQFSKTNEIAFTSERKMMSVIGNLNSMNYQLTKGAYEKIISLCNKIIINGEEVNLSPKLRRLQDFLVQQMTKKALRVIAFSYKKTKVLDETDMVFVGFVGMIDPPKRGVKEAVKILKEAGIDTIMITGDNINTAYAIAHELDIVNSSNECVEGKYLDTLSDQRLKQLVKEKKVFARTSPSQKIRIVEAYQQNDLIVAMTGDGVNDAPSLRKADVGIAMGKNGTEVAKNAADMVLLDDNYGSILRAVKEGRGMFQNIKKTTMFLLSSNFAEVMAMIIGIILSLPVPLIAVHILWVNLITDSLPAVALSVDRCDDKIMKEKPRQKKEGLFVKKDYILLLFYGVIITLITMISYFIIPVSIIIKNQGLVNLLSNVRNILETDQVILLKSRTFAFTTLGISQLFHMIGMSDIKSFFYEILKKKNYIMFLSLIIGILLQVIVTEVPLLSDFFHISQLSINEWSFLILVSSIPLIIHEIIVLIYKIETHYRSLRG